MAVAVLSPVEILMWRHKEMPQKIMSTSYIVELPGCMESPCRMVSCIFYLMLLSALAISTSLSPDNLFLLCLYLFGGVNSVIRWEKRILSFFFLSHYFSAESVTWPGLLYSLQTAIIAKLKAARKQIYTFGNKSCIGCCCFQKRHIKSHALSGCWIWEPDLWAPLNNCLLENLFSSAARGK